MNLHVFRDRILWAFLLQKKKDFKYQNFSEILFYKNSKDFVISKVSTPGIVILPGKQALL